MKRTERHHLKENELAHLAAKVQQAATAKSGPIQGVLIAVVLVIIAIVGYSYWSGRSETQAQARFVEASIVAETRVGPPPAAGEPVAAPTFATERERNEAALAKFTAVADEFGSTDAGVMARYRAAAILMSLGRPAEAVAAYETVVSRAGGDVLGDMARLGLAQAQLEAGRHDQAIESYKALAERRDGPMPQDAVLIQLARAYQSAGKIEEARQTLTRIVEEFPASPFTADARRDLEALKTT